MHKNEYEHTGIDLKGRVHTFWSLAVNASKNQNSCFDGLRWLKECVPTGETRKYHKHPATFSSGNSYAFYH